MSNTQRASEGDRPNPLAMPLDDRRVYDAYIAGRQSAALAASVRAGLFDLLHRSDAPLTFAAIQDAMQWSKRGTRSMLSALEAMGFLMRDAGGFTASPDARRYLARDEPGSLWGLIDMEVDHYLSPTALLDALKSDDSSVYGDADPWEAHEQDPEKARAFTAAMHSVSERPAAGFAEHVDLEGNQRLLDVGGGSGAVSIALARQNPALRCTIWDLAVIGPIAAEYVAAADLSARIDTAAGDMFNEPLPKGYDTVLYSQILHDWGFEKGNTLLSKAFDALEPGGRVLIHEKLVEDDGSGPLANVLVHLDMLVWTEGQQYGVTELKAALEAAGFADVERTRTCGYWSVVSGRKPA